MTDPLSDERIAQIRANAIGLWPDGDYNDAAKDVSDLLAEVERLRAYPAALERTERGLTKPCRLGSLAALLSELLCGRYAETAASPKAMKRILQDVADLYRGLVQAGGHDASGYFPSLPPLSSEEAETLWSECLEEARSQL